MLLSGRTGVPWSGGAPGSRGIEEASDQLVRLMPNIGSIYAEGLVVFLAKTKTLNPFWLAVSDRVNKEPSHDAMMLRKVGIWEPPQTEFVTKLMQRACAGGGAKRMVNAGGFVGYYTMLAASFGCIKVDVWEPNPENAALLQLGIILNGYAERVTLHQNICTEETGVMQFAGEGMDGHVRGSYAAAADSLGAGRKREVTEGDGAHDHHVTEVRPLAVDTVVGGFDEVELMVIDTEGYEPHVMQSAHKLLESTRVKVIMFEYNLYRAMTPKAGVAILVKLLGLGYSVSVPFGVPYAAPDGPTACLKPQEINTPKDAVKLTEDLKEDRHACFKYAVEVVACLKGAYCPV